MKLINTTEDSLWCVQRDDKRALPKAVELKPGQSIKGCIIIINESINILSFKGNLGEMIFDLSLYKDGKIKFELEK